jgi:ParB family chromosome partitioning protein
MEVNEPMNETENDKIVRIPVERIKLGVFTPRTTSSEEHVAELAESMRRSGQWNPVLIHKETMGCISGECRIQAAKMLSWKEIDAKILDIPKMDAYRLALETNIKQKNLSTIEEANHLSKMIKMFDWSQRQAARELGKSDIWVRDRLRLLDLNPEIQQMIVRGILAPSHGIEIAKVADRELQMTLANRIVRDNIPTGERTECMVRESQFLADSAKDKEELKTIIEAAERLTTTDLQEIVRQRQLGLHVDFAYRVGLKEEGAITYAYPCPGKLFERLIAGAKKTGKDLNMVIDEAVEDFLKEHSIK